LKVPRDDADDRPQQSVETDLAPDDAGIGIEPRPPQRLAQHDDMRPLDVVFVGERPAGDRRDPEHVEYSRGDPLPRHRFGVAVRAGHDHAADGWREAGNLLERPAPRVPVEHVERRHVAGGVLRGPLPQGDESIGLTEGQRPEQGRIDEREDRAVGADAERQGQRGDQREARRVPQLPERGFQIVPELVDPEAHAHLAVSLSAKASHRLLEGGDIAQSTDRDLAGGLRIHAARDELARAVLDVQREFFVDLLIDREAPEPRTKRTFHVESRTFDTPVENRRQVAISASSCWRPAPVRR
jgi:hypothetical protein